jgi:hypothetical protein
MLLFQGIVNFAIVFYRDANNVGAVQVAAVILVLTVLTFFYLTNVTYVTHL